MSSNTDDESKLELIARVDKKFDHVIDLLEELRSRPKEYDDRLEALEEDFKDIKIDVKGFTAWMIEHKTKDSIEHEKNRSRKERLEGMFQKAFNGAITVLGGVALLYVLWLIYKFFGIQLR